MKYCMRCQSTIRRCRGTASIEFALLFIPFFAMFYAIVSYGVVMLLIESFTLAAQEGARVALAVDPVSFPDNGTYQNAVESRVKARVAVNLSWLPATVKNKVLGDGNQNIQVAVDGTGTLSVTVQYADYRSTPLIPILVLPGLGAVPNVPQNLLATAKMQL